MAPVVTFSHFTSPHWFAKTGGWLDPGAPASFARFVDVVMRRFGDRIAYAVTFNEPNLTRVLSWYGLPDFVHDLERATLQAASQAAGVERYRAGNVVLAEDFDGIEDGMAAGHVAARSVIRSHRADLPVGLSLAIMDDVVVGDDPSVRDRKRRECYQRFLELARDDDFIGVQNYERVPYDGAGKVEAPADAARNQMGTVIEPGSLAGAARWAYEVSGVPVLVTEHGMATQDDRDRAGFIEPALDHLLDAMEDGVPVIGYCHWTLLDNFEWIFGYEYQLGLHEVDRETLTRTPKPSADAYAALVRSHRG
jgi:beta-glucosidase